MPNTLSKENELQRKAFELYYGLGDKRSLRAVAETIGRTERTVAGWSRAFNWVARVTQRNIENAQNSNEAKITAELTDVRTKYRILINNLMADFSKDIAQGKVNAPNFYSIYGEPCALFLLTEGQSGSRKSTSKRLADYALKEHERRKYDAYQKNFQEWTHALASCVKKEQKTLIIPQFPLQK